MVFNEKTMRKAHHVGINGDQISLSDNDLISISQLILSYFIDFIHIVISGVNFMQKYTHTSTGGFKP